MKKLNKVAVLFASVALAAPISAFAQKSIDNWRNADGSLVWKNGTNELCWRDAFWTPATAAENCDGAIKPPVAPARPRAGCSSPAAPGPACPAAGSCEREGHLRC